MASFAGADGERSWLVGVVVSMAILSIALVVLRLISRRQMHQKLWWDDRMILASLASTYLLDS